MNLATLSPEFPINVSDEDYSRLTRKTTGGWSQCDTMDEWLVKLHYLRTGYKEGKIPADEFFKKEQDLVLNWWAKWC